MVLENLSEDHYTHPVYYKKVNETGNPDVWYLANDMHFGNAELKRDKKVILMDRRSEEMRIAYLVAGGDFTGPVFDKHETLITHEVLGVEL